MKKWAICILLIGFAVSGFSERVENAGLYAIWVNQKEMEIFHSLPFITGGQTVVQWRDVEPTQGEYDFSEIDRSMEWFSARGQKASLQINGNRKPLWLFDKVPYHPEKLSHQINDEKGSLMFWHPVHRDAYRNMLNALAAHLKKSTYRENILGIRLNFIPFGTEHHTPKGKPDLSIEKWIIPEGVDPSSVTEYKKKVVDEYLQAIVETYVSNFKDTIRVFLRNGANGEILVSYRSLFENGTLSWFHTSSEAEPRASSGEMKYRRFYDDCRSGMTTAYAEPWASAWGHHGGMTDDRWCSPPQWHYWRLLNDLHCGVSFIAVYSTDTRVAINGIYKSTGVTYSDGIDGTYQAEFSQALEFTATYAGYHAAPEESPGAWIAFRENNTVLAENGVSAKRRKLKFFNTDYTFLMKRLPGDKSVGQGITNIGPDNQRFGAWARKLPAREEIRLELNPQFSASLTTGTTIRITYFDDASGKFSLSTKTGKHPIKMEGSNRWKTTDVPMTDNSQQITITAGDSPLLLHMVEVRR